MNCRKQIVGEVKMIAGEHVPDGWMLCQGQTLLIAARPALYNAIGTTYGGDGVTTFNLPDLRGRFPLATGVALTGLSGHVLGETGGSEWVALDLGNLPAHSHSFMASSIDADLAYPNGNTLATEPTGSTAFYRDIAPDVALNEASISATGEGESFSTMPPFLALNFIIAVDGECC